MKKKTEMEKIRDENAGAFLCRAFRVFMNVQFHMKVTIRFLFYMNVQFHTKVRIQYLFIMHGQFKRNSQYDIQFHMNTVFILSTRESQSCIYPNK